MITNFQYSWQYFLYSQTIFYHYLNLRALLKRSNFLKKYKLKIPNTVSLIVTFGLIKTQMQKRLQLPDITFLRVLICYSCSVAQSCPILYDPMDCSTPGLPVPHHLPKSARVHVHCIGDAISCRILSYPLLLLLSIFPSIRVLSNESLFASGDQNTGASASVLPMSLQGCLPLRLTGLISLLSRGFSGVFSNTTLWRLQFFSALLS